MNIIKMLQTKDLMFIFNPLHTLVTDLLTFRALEEIYTDWQYLLTNSFDLHGFKSMCTK